MSVNTRQTVPVTGEFGPLVIDGQRRGGYAVIVDVSSLIEAEYKAFESSQRGIMRIDTSGRITFANSRVAEIFGLPKDELLGSTVRELFTDPESRQRLAGELERRDEGLGGLYPLTYHRRRDGRTFRVRVNGMPEYDNLGERTGSLGIIELLEFEDVSQRIHDIIAQRLNCHALIDGVLQAVKSLLPFEFASVAIYTDDMTWARVIHCTPEQSPPWETKWFPISPEMREWIRSDKTWHRDLRAFLIEQPGARELAENPTVRRFVDEGYRSFLSFPSREGDRVPAVLSLCTREVGSFDAARYNLLKRIPIEKALRVARFLHDREERDFIYQLLKSIGGLGSSEDVARLLVGELARFYDWQNIAIFKVNRVRNRFELLAQAEGRHDGFPLPSGYGQELEHGILGYVYRTGETVNVGNVHDPASHPLAAIYVPSTTATRSELCIPVQVLGQINWLLNLEDKRLNAFSPSDIEALDRVIHEIEITLQQIFHNITFEQIFAVASDAIVLTDFEGAIRRCNPAAEDMLGISEATAAGRSIGDFIPDQEMAEWVLSNNVLTRQRIRIRAPDGDERSVFVTGAALPDEYDRKVVFLDDIASRDWQRDLYSIAGVLGEVAAETRVPLSLAANLMRRVSRRISESPLHDAVDAAVLQLRKVEITYDRVLFACDREKMPHVGWTHLDVEYLIAQAVEQLPREEREETDTTIAAGLPAVRGDAYQLGFVLQSILNYLLRDKPPDERMTVAADLKAGVVRIRICGPHVEEPPAATDVLEAAELEARASVALGEPVIRRIVEDTHNGYYRRRRSDDDHVIFEITLPAATANGRRGRYG